MIHSTTLRGLATPLVTLLLSFAVLAIGCVPDSGNPADGNDSDPNNADGNGNGDGQGDSNGDSSGFTLAEKIDPHITILAQQLLAKGGDAAVIAWPGETLLPEDYDGAMRATSGVLAGFMGNDLDRCRLVRELLSAAGIANRFALSGDDCTVEALVDNEPLHVPTSRFDEGPIPDDWGRPTSIPAASFHAIEIVESYCPTVFSSVECEPIEHSLGTWTLAELASAPVIADYVEDAEGLRLRIRTGRRGDREESFGAVVGDANRHDLIFRYTRPTQDPIEYTRILFDGASTIMNQSPDVGVDVYAIWFGANVVSERYLDVENALADLAEDDAETGEVLYLRAIELAMETDNAAWQLFDGTELDGGAFFDGARIVIAAQERRYDGHDGITPSFDLLSNSRRIRESTDPVAASFALGYIDAMVEGAVLERSTGSPGVVVPDIFAGLFQEEADDVVSRAEMFESALARLENEGVTEEALVFLDEASGANVQVTLIGNALLLVLDDDDIDRLEIIAQEPFDELLTTVDGVVIGEGADRSWPIDLLIMDKGAAVNYRARIEHIESPQLALATPTGTHIQGSATYLGESLRIRGIARRFEQTDVDSGTDEKRDRSDWHLFDETGSLIGSGATDRPTAELDEYNPRILQWGEDPSTISFYESPLWVAPALAAGIRSRVETECRITTDTGGASDWIAVTLTEFSDSRMTVTIDGQPVGIQTIVATDTANEYEIVIAKHGLTRTILGLRTPNGEAAIDSIITPRSLRLRGRIVSQREPIGLAGVASYSVGVGNASISSGGLIGTSWPDGTVDLRVADTAQPTLRGGIGILIDTSNSMGEPADADCIDACTPKIEVVSDALADIIAQTEEGVELAVWGFPTTLEDGCLSQVRELAGWSLSREATETARNSLGEAY
ncbi:MAG: hypothetical protein IID36_13845, partial [Planctomycetes bacterium]|nr:hypothetical protein [Planctomycetota bacterium]